MQTKAFTLIEILIVVAVVGVLSGIVVISVSDSQESAKIAKIKGFSDSLRNSMLTSLVSEWKLDEGSGLPQDCWDSNNAATSTAAWITNGCVGGSCLSFNSTQVLINDSSSLRPGEEITVEAWFKLNTLSGTHTIVSKDNPGPTNYWMDVRASGTSICVGGYTSLSAACYNCASITVSAQEWHHLAFSYNRIQMKIFLDGEERSSLNLTCELNSNTAPLRFGTRNGTGNFLNGYVDQVRIYNEALSLSQIQEHYKEGKEKFYSKI